MARIAFGGDDGECKPRHEDDSQLVCVCMQHPSGHRCASPLLPPHLNGPAVHAVRDRVRVAHAHAGHLVLAAVHREHLLHHRRAAGGRQ